MKWIHIIYYIAWKVQCDNGAFTANTRVIQDGCVECQQRTNILIQHNDALATTLTQKDHFLFMIHCFYNENQSKIFSFKRKCLNPRQKIFEKTVQIQAERRDIKFQLFKEDEANSPYKHSRIEYSRFSLLRLPYNWFKYVINQFSEIFHFNREICLECRKRNQYISPITDSLSQLQQFMILVLGPTTRQNLLNNVCQIRRTTQSYFAPPNTTLHVVVSTYNNVAKLNVTSSFTSEEIKINQTTSAEGSLVNDRDDDNEDDDVESQDIQSQESRPSPIEISSDEVIVEKSSEELNKPAAHVRWFGKIRNLWANTEPNKDVIINKEVQSKGILLSRDEWYRWILFQFRLYCPYPVTHVRKNVTVQLITQTQSYEDWYHWFISLFSLQCVKSTLKVQEIRIKSNTLRNDKRVVTTYSVWHKRFLSSLKLQCIQYYTEKQELKKISSQDQVIKFHDYNAWYRYFVLCLRLRSKYRRVGVLEIPIPHSHGGQPVLREVKDFHLKRKSTHLEGMIRTWSQRQYGGEVEDSYFYYLLLVFFFLKVFRKSSQTNSTSSVVHENELAVPLDQVDAIPSPSSKQDIEKQIIEKRNIEFEWIVAVVEISPYPHTTHLNVAV